MPPDFELSERDLRPGWREVAIQGELDLAVSGRLRAALGRARADQRQILLDLSGCDFIDASAIKALIQAERRGREEDLPILVRGAHGQVQRLLSIVGIVASENGAAAIRTHRWTLARVSARGTASRRQPHMGRRGE